MYTHLKIWTNPKGETWHSYYTPGTRDATISYIEPWQVSRIIESAKKNGKVVEDER